jgi:hypothetical protein
MIQFTRLGIPESLRRCDSSDQGYFRPIDGESITCIEAGTCMYTAANGNGELGRQNGVTVIQYMVFEAAAYLHR